MFDIRARLRGTWGGFYRPVLICLLGLALLWGSQPARGGLVDPDRALAHLRAQCALGPRNPGSPGHAACKAYIIGALRQSGAQVDTFGFSYVPPWSERAIWLTDIVGRFGSEATGGILFGAHWDTRPRADRDPNPDRRGDPILGANDGASGVGLLLALAEGLSNQVLEKPVYLVFFDGEDLGREGHPEEYLIGSRHMAAEGLLPKVELAIIFDMVASESATIGLESTSRHLFPLWSRLVEEAMRAVGTDVFDLGPTPSLIDDHVPLIEAGLAALLVADFRDPYWHTHADTPSHCCRRGLGACGALAEQILVMLGCVR